MVYYVVHQLIIWEVVEYREKGEDNGSNIQYFRVSNLGYQLKVFVKDFGHFGD